MQPKVAMLMANLVKISFNHLVLGNAFVNGIGVTKVFPFCNLVSLSTTGQRLSFEVGRSDEALELRHELICFGRVAVFVVIPKTVNKIKIRPDRFFSIFCLTAIK